MKTLLNIKEQQEFISKNWKIATVSHKWSCRGYGNSKILNANGETISKATGCGYDRFGTAIGAFIELNFQTELQQLAKRFCKTKYTGYQKSSEQFYGMFLRADGSVRLDGACGYNCMFKILNCIGFELTESGKYEKSNNGETFYTLRPVSKQTKNYVVKPIK